MCIDLMKSDEHDVDTMRSESFGYLRELLARFDAHVFDFSVIVID